MANARDDGELFFEGPRHARLDEIRRQLTGPRDNDDARELHLGIDAARQHEDRLRPERSERESSDPHELAWRRSQRTKLIRCSTTSG